MIESPSTPIPLNKEALASAVDQLVVIDPDLAGIARKIGLPPLWERPAGFATLIHIILEQQVSLASAKAAFERLLALASPLTPARFLAFDEATLKAIGFSRQKAGYGRLLAEALLAGQLDLAALEQMDDATVRAQLTAIKGIGPWTANIYLLMVLRRPDIWPSGDLALAVAVQQIKQLPARPTTPELETIALAWQPWRAVAARLLWHHYLSKE
jgi:DNA-3-methyladenine glycosylase II